MCLGALHTLMAQGFPKVTNVDRIHTVMNPGTKPDCHSSLRWGKAWVPPPMIHDTSGIRVLPSLSTSARSDGVDSRGGNLDPKVPNREAH